MSEPQVPSATGPTLHRRVFYIAGFDPRGAQFYHRLYADNAALQNEVHARAHAAGHRAVRALQTFTVGPLEADARFDANWAVQARPVGDERPDAVVHTRYTYLSWDDLARTNTPRGVVPALKALWAFNTLLWTAAASPGRGRMPSGFGARSSRRCCGLWRC